MDRYKHPRTPHLVKSPGKSVGDTIVIRDDLQFENRDVVATLKLDGECTSIYSDGFCHARSIDSKYHPSRTFVKRLAAQIGPNLPPSYHLVGENLYARHSTPYTSLPGYFFVFAVVADGTVLSWADTLDWIRRLSLNPVPQLWRGSFKDINHTWLTQVSNQVAPWLNTPEGHEGYVVRDYAAFPYKDWDKHTAKWVRLGFIKTDTHWIDHWEKNKVMK